MFFYREISFFLLINFVTIIYYIRIVLINYNNHSNDSFMMSYTMIKIKIKTLSSKASYSRMTFKQIVLKTIKTIHKINKIFTISLNHLFAFLVTSIIRIALQMIFKDRNNNFNEFIIMSRMRMNTIQFIMKYSITIITMMRNFTMTRIMIKKIIMNIMITTIKRIIKALRKKILKTSSLFLSMNRNNR